MRSSKCLALYVARFAEALTKRGCMTCGTIKRSTADKADHQSRRLLRARRERPHRCATEQRDERAPFHWPMSPVPPSERIAHLGTVDCWIYPPGRYETIAVTPPIIFSKGGSPKH